MTIWVGAIVLIVLLLGTLIVTRGGKDGRAARRELRQLRKESGRGVNATLIAERRRAHSLPQAPGSTPTPGTF